MMWKEAVMAFAWRVCEEPRKLSFRILGEEFLYLLGYNAV
jgi:hypothetical protein